MATKKIPFRTLLDDPVVIETNAGEHEENVIAMKLNEKGEEEFYISGKTNIYERNQADADICNIEGILAKVLATGDYTILNKAQGQFMDLTETPQNLMEAHQKIREAEKTFSELPLKIRTAYNNNFDEYLADVGSDKWLEIVGLKEPEIKMDPVPEEKGETE